MIFFDQTEYSKIPTRENKRRIKALMVFRDLYLDLVMFPLGNRIPLLTDNGPNPSERGATQRNQSTKASDSKIV
jgi:hypothetical protein